MPSIFAIDDLRSFHSKASADLDHLKDQIDDAGRAMNCILSLYHIHEWAWATWIKQRAPLTLRGEILRTQKDFIGWLERQSPYFNVVQDLANGTKHCRAVAYGASAASGYGSGPYGIGPYGVPYLLIDLGSDLPPGERWLVAHSALAKVHQFWSELLVELGI